jgi:hypothetical protein
MKELSEYCADLSADLWKSPDAEKLVYGLTHVHPNSARAALEESIKELRGQVTDEDRRWLDTINASQLIQVLTVSGAGVRYDADVFPEPRSSGKDLLKQPALKDSQYFYMIDGRDQNHPDHPFNKDYKPFPDLSVPETIEDQLVLPQWFVDKVHAKGGTITMAGIIYEKETEANGERTARENNRQDMLYERYLSNYREMAEHRWTVIEGGQDRGIKQLQDLDPKLLLEAIEKEVYGIMGGSELESLIFRTPELKAKLSENAKRYSNRPMGLLGDIPLYITADVTPACMDKFFFVTRERILPAHF